MPVHVRDAIDGITGAPVAEATNLSGGFSPGPAARCTLTDGRTVFVKSAGLDLNPHTPGMHRREAQVLTSLGSDLLRQSAPLDCEPPRLVNRRVDGSSAPD